MTKARTKGQKLASKRERLYGGDVCAISGVTIAADPVETPSEQLRRAHETSGGKGTPKRIRFRDASPLDRALHRGAVTDRQHAAGDAFEALYLAAGGMRGPRSCLDWTPRGHSDVVTAKLIDAARSWRELSQALGMIRGAAVRDVVIDWQPLGSARTLMRRRVTDGLDVAADFFGLAHE